MRSRQLPLGGVNCEAAGSGQGGTWQLPRCAQSRALVVSSGGQWKGWSDGGREGLCFESEIDSSKPSVLVTGIISKYKDVLERVSSEKALATGDRFLYVCLQVS